MNRLDRECSGTLGLSATAAFTPACRVGSFGHEATLTRSRRFLARIGQNPADRCRKGTAAAGHALPTKPS